MIFYESLVPNIAMEHNNSHIQWIPRSRAEWIHSVLPIRILNTDLENFIVWGLSMTNALTYVFVSDTQESDEQFWDEEVIDEDETCSWWNMMSTFLVFRQFNSYSINRYQNTHTLIIYNAVLTLDNWQLMQNALYVWLENHSWYCIINQSLGKCDLE